MLECSRATLAVGMRAALVEALLLHRVSLLLELAVRAMVEISQLINSGTPLDTANIHPAVPFLMYPLSDGALGAWIAATASSRSSEQEWGTRRGGGGGEKKKKK